MPDQATPTQGATIMTFDESEITWWTEADLLSVVVHIYEIRNKQHTHLEDIRAALGGKSAQAITNYMAAAGSIGVEGWQRLWTLTHYEIIRTWFRIHAPFLTEDH